MSTPEISVVLPVANQADHLVVMLTDVEAALSSLGQSFEIVVVVNASRDDSLSVARAYAAERTSVIIIESEPGWGSAVRAGLAVATGSYLCYTNSARTQPSDLVRAFRYVVVDPDALVKASRQTRDSLTRRIGSVLYNLEIRVLFHVAIWDVNGTPKVFHRNLLSSLDLTEDGDLIDAQLAVHCREQGIPVVEFSVYDTTRRSGVSTTRVKSATKMYRGLLRMWSDERGGRSAVTSSEPSSQQR